MRRAMLSLILPAALLFSFCDAALAYIGPGAGITLMGALWGVIVAIALAIGAVLFWPFRILMRRYRNRNNKTAPEKTAAPVATNDTHD